MRHRELSEAIAVIGGIDDRAREEGKRDGGRSSRCGFESCAPTLGCRHHRAIRRFR